MARFLRVSIGTHSNLTTERSTSSIGRSCHVRSNECPVDQYLLQAKACLSMKLQTPNWALPCPTPFSSEELDKLAVISHGLGLVV